MLRPYIFYPPCPVCCCYCRPRPTARRRSWRLRGGSAWNSPSLLKSPARCRRPVLAGSSPSRSGIPRAPQPRHCCLRSSTRLRRSWGWTTTPPSSRRPSRRNSGSKAIRSTPSRRRAISISNASCSPRLACRSRDSCCASWMKPLRLSASRGVIRANNAQSFVEAHGRLKAIVGEPGAAFLIEEFIPGYEVAVEGLVVNRRLHVLAVFDKPDPLDGPFFEETIYVTPSTVPAGLQAAIRDCADRAVRALGITDGPIHAELRYNENGPWLIELAARPIGGRCSAVLRFADQKISLEEIILRHALGMPIPSLAREHLAAGVMMIPIPGAGRLQEVRGVAEAKQVPLVEDVQITAHPGERLIPFPEGSRYPGFIFARGETPAVVETALREAHRRLTFVLA